MGRNAYNKKQAKAAAIAAEKEAREAALKIVRDAQAKFYASQKELKKKVAVKAEAARKAEAKRLDLYYQKRAADSLTMSQKHDAARADGKAASDSYNVTYGAGLAELKRLAVELATVKDELQANKTFEAAKEKFRQSVRGAYDAIPVVETKEVSLFLNPLTSRQISFRKSQADDAALKAADKAVAALAAMPAGERAASLAAMSAQEKAVLVAMPADEKAAALAAMPADEKAAAIAAVAAMKKPKQKVKKRCIAGTYGKANYVEMTLAKAKAACTSRGLVMCKKSCQGKDCWYNKGYVWTDIPCEDEQTKEAGVLALSGISEAPSKGVCITSASAVTARGKKISAQCCTASGECQRQSVKMPAEGKTCADVKGTMAAGSTCGARIKWVEDNKDMTKKDAQDFVGDEFPTDCGPCLVSAPKAEEPPSTRRRRKMETSIAQSVAASQFVFQLGNTDGLPLNHEYHEQT